MADTTAREQILKSIRKALMEPGPQAPAPTSREGNDYPELQEPLAVEFAKRWTANHGKFVYCAHADALRKDLAALLDELGRDRPSGRMSLACAHPTLKRVLDDLGVPYLEQPEPKDRADLQVGITDCEGLVARSGSVVVSDQMPGGRELTILPHTHIIIGYTSQVVAEIADALKNVRQKYGDRVPPMVSFIGGPSRTADIEKTLVLGAHGPALVYCFLVEDQ